MLAQFPMMKATDVVKLLEHFGFKRIRVHGSHWIFFNEVTNKQTVVSMHKKIFPKAHFLRF